MTEMPPDVDENKQACILAWIGSILQKQLTASDLYDGVIFLDLLCLTKDFVVDVSKLEKPIDRFCRIEEILDEFFHTSSVRFVNYEDILQPNENANYNVTACALLVLTLGLQSKNSVLFMRAAQKLSEEFHQEVVALTENLVKVDTTYPLSSEMFCVLKQSSSGSHERDCTTPILASRPPFGFYDSPLAPLQSLLRSPQILQKSRLREKEVEIRRLRSALDNERRLRGELDAELAESQRRLIGQEHRLEEASVRVRAAQREGRDLRQEAENAVCYRQRAESAEEERDRLRCRLERLQSLASRNKALEEELRELHAERTSLRQQLENYAGSEMRQRQMTLLELELSELRDNLSKAKAELTLVSHARDHAVEESVRLSEAVMELRRQLSEHRSMENSAEFVGTCPGYDSVASTPNMELPPLGERMSLLSEKRVLELERTLDELRASSVPRADYEGLLADYEDLQLRRQALSDELAGEKRRTNELERQCRLHRLEFAIPGEGSPAGEVPQPPLLSWSTPPSSPPIRRSKRRLEVEEAPTREHEEETVLEDKKEEEGEEEGAEWAKAIGEAVSEVMEEVEAEDAGDDAIIAALETDPVDDIDTARSSLSTSDPDEVVRRPPNAEAHLQELRENRRSLAHEIVELNFQFEELQQHNETLQEEAEFARQLAAENVQSLRGELVGLRRQHGHLSAEFASYQRQIGREMDSLAGQVGQLLEENSRLKMERLERPEMRPEMRPEEAAELEAKRALVTAQNSALLQMINNLKDQVKALLLEPLGSAELLTLDDEANYICNGSSSAAGTRLDSPCTEEAILERLGAIIDEFCASMCSLAGRMQEDSRKRQEMEALQATLNKSLDSNVKLGCALQEANASLLSKESCMAEMELAKNSLVEEVEKLKVFMRTLEASLENSELEYKQAFDALQATAEHLGQVASQKQDSILRLQSSVGELTLEKKALMERILALEEKMQLSESEDGAVNGNVSFEDTLRSAVEERNAMNSKLVNIEAKLETLVTEKEMNEFTNQSLSENVIEMSLENENMAAMIKHLEEIVEQFKARVEALNEEVRRKEEERSEALERSAMAFVELEKESDERSAVLEELVQLRAEKAQAQSDLLAKSALSETLARQLQDSEAARQEVDTLRAEVLERRETAVFLQKTNVQLKSDLREAEQEQELLMEDRQTLEREAAALREAKAAMERQRAGTQQQRERLEEQLRSRESDIARLRAEGEQSSRAATRARDEAEGSRRRLQEVEAELQEARERSKRRLQEVEAERAELEEARERCLRRAGALQSEVEEARRRAEEQQEELELARADLQSAQASEEALRLRLATLERESRSTKRSHSPGEDFQSQILGYKNRIVALEGRLRFLDDEVGRLEKQAMEWRARANSLEEKNRLLDEQLKRYVESYEAKKTALKEAYEKIDNESRLKEHFKQKNIYLEEEVLPLRRRQSELSAENRRLVQRVRSLEAQLEFASRMVKNGGKNSAAWRSSLPPQGLELSQSFVPPFPTDSTDATSPSRLSNVSDGVDFPASVASASRSFVPDGCDGSEQRRLVELQRRNCIQPDHMKTSYPVETQTCDARDVIEILGSSSTTTVVRKSMASTLPPRTSAFDASENLFSSLRPSHRSPTRSTGLRKNRPSSTPLLQRDANRESIRCSPIPPQSGGTAFEIMNTPKRPADVSRAAKTKPLPRTQSFQSAK